MACGSQEDSCSTTAQTSVGSSECLVAVERERATRSAGGGMVGVIVQVKL
jgi:hypothetical protein